MRRVDRLLIVLFALASPAFAGNPFGNGNPGWTSQNTSRVSRPRPYKEPRNTRILEQMDQMSYERVRRPQTLDQEILYTEPLRLPSLRPVKNDRADDLIYSTRVSRQRMINTTPESYGVTPERVGKPSLSANSEPYLGGGFRIPRDQRIGQSGLAQAAGVAPPAGVRPSVGIVTDSEESPNSIRRKYAFRDADREMSRRPVDTPKDREGRQYTGETLAPARTDAAYRQLQRGTYAERIRNPVFQTTPFPVASESNVKIRDRALPKLDRSNSQAIYDGSEGSSTLFRKAARLKRDKAPVAPLFTVQ